MAGTEPTVVSTVVDGIVATITLDAPENRNALSAGLVAGISEALRTVEKDDRVRFVVMTHAGSTFCAGADLAEAAREGGPEAGTRRLVDLLRTIVAFPKPVVAAVNGHVRAGGIGLVGACDLAFAGPASTFALTEARLGLAPAIISLTLEPKLDPRAWSECALTGSTFGPDRAARIGVITEAVDDVAEAVDTLTATLRKASPQGLAATKALVNTVIVERFDQQAEALVRRSAELFASDEAREGIAAFKERRPPRWASD